MESLTSLRFGAAVMVLTVHILGTFDLLLKGPCNNLGLWQALSWFFVLSGFIMAYVHPKLSDTRAVNEYLLARFARIWPSYFVAFCLYTALVPTSTKGENAGIYAVLYLLMIQSWTLIKPAVKAFNTPGWSVSAECFFYIYFPVLLKSFEQKWKTKLLFTFSLVLISVTAAALAAWPNFTPTINLDVNVNPLCRLFEFSLGMATCLAYRRFNTRLQWSKGTATLLEALSLLSIAAFVMVPRLLPAMENHYWWNPVRIWIDFAGGAPLYAINIFIFARERGAISKFLTNKFAVLLGELSFSIYLFHLPVLMYFQEHYDKNKEGALVTAIIAASIIYFALARVNFILIEMPCRKAIIDLGRIFLFDKQGSWWTKMQAARQSLGKAFKLPLVRAIEIALLAAVIAATCIANYVQDRHFRFVNEKKVAANLGLSDYAYRQVCFGQAFALRGLIKKESKDGIHMRMFWQSLRDQKLEYGNGIHLLDNKGQVLSYHDYFQDDLERHVKKGQFWQDEYFISAEKLKNAAAIGLAVYSTKPLAMLVVTGGPVDKSGRRMYIPIAMAADYATNSDATNSDIRSILTDKK